MKHKRHGFTLIEISLFLAITGLLFMGIIMGTQNVLRDQRFFDSTQNFYEFLKSLYSQVSNPQSQGAGNSEQYAIYGKLIVFGQNTGLDGNTINNDGTQRIYSYDVVGDASGNMSGDVKAALKNMHANVFFPKNAKSIIPAGLVEDYIPRWDSEIEVTANGDPFTGSILIVRHPNSGTINTLYSSTVIQVNSVLKNANAVLNSGGTYDSYKTTLTSVMDSFTTKDLDFCVNPDSGNVNSDRRRNIRIVKNARNSSGVELVDLDGADNRCNR